MKDKYERIVDQFERYYPNLYEQSVDWWPSGRLYITVKLNDGSTLEFDSTDNSIRKVRASERVTDVDILRKDIGHNLRKVIQIKGMSKTDIAEGSGITQAMLSRYIHGKSMPSIDKLYSIANVLGCRVVDILGDLEVEE